jgi:hypothetical protein
MVNVEVNIVIVIAIKNKGDKMIKEEISLKDLIELRIKDRKKYDEFIKNLKEVIKDLESIEDEKFKKYKKKIQE